MAIVYKTFLNSDKTTTRTLLHEAIPITGAILSGTYGSNNALGNETNLKHYAHGMFQSIYDYPYLSSSANHIIDITVGASVPGTTYSTTVDGDIVRSGLSYYSRITDAAQKTKKKNMYLQMAQLLGGHDASGNIRRFDSDGNYASLGDKIDFPVFLSFSRLLVKDEIKKGSFALSLGVDGRYDKALETRILITDHGAADKHHINSPAGEYGLLYASEVGSGDAIADNMHAGGTSAAVVGLLYYQAGVCVLDCNKIFSGSANYKGAGFSTGILKTGGYNAKSGVGVSSPTAGGTGEEASGAKVIEFTHDGDGYRTAAQTLTGSSIQAFANGFRRRIYNVSFNNTTELNSTVYFCRAGHNEFNHSSNPTYLNGSLIRVKNVASDMPRSYITTVGLYSADNELLAVAKLSEPIRKDPTNEVTLRVRLDY